MAVPRLRARRQFGGVPQVEPDRSGEIVAGTLANIAGGMADIAFSEHRRKTLQEAEKRGFADGIRRDADGNLTFRSAAEDTEAARTYNRAASTAFLAAKKTDAAALASKLHRENPADPAAFEAAWFGAGEEEGAAQTLLRDTPELVRPDLELHVRQLGQRSLARIGDQRRKLDMTEAKQRSEARLSDLHQEIVDLSMAGKGASPDVAVRLAEAGDVLDNMVESDLITRPEAQAQEEAIADAGLAASATHDVEQAYKAGGLLAARKRAEEIWQGEELDTLSEDQRMAWFDQAIGRVNRLEQTRSQARVERYQAFLAELQDPDADPMAVAARAEKAGLKGGQLATIRSRANARAERTAERHREQTYISIRRGIGSGEFGWEELAQMPPGTLAPKQMFQVENDLRSEVGPRPGSEAASEAARERWYSFAADTLEKRMVTGEQVTQAEIEEALPFSEPAARRLNLSLTRKLASGEGAKAIERERKLTDALTAYEGGAALTGNAAGRERAGLFMETIANTPDGERPALAGADDMDRRPVALFEHDQNVPFLADATVRLGVAPPQMTRGMEHALWRAPDPATVDRAVDTLDLIQSNDARTAARVRNRLSSQALEVYRLVGEGMTPDQARETVQRSAGTSQTSERRTASSILEEIGTGGELDQMLDETLSDKALERHAGDFWIRSLRGVSRTFVTAVTPLPYQLWQKLTTSTARELLDPGLDQPEMPEIPDAMREDYWRTFASIRATGFVKGSDGEEAAARAAADKVLERWGVAFGQAPDPQNVDVEQPLQWVETPWSDHYKGPDGNDFYFAQELGRMYDENVGRSFVVRREREAGTGRQPEGIETDPRTMATGFEMIQENRLQLFALPGAEKDKRPKYGVLWVDDNMRPHVIKSEDERIVTFDPTYEGSRAFKIEQDAARWVQDNFGPVVRQFFSGVLTDLRVSQDAEWNRENVRGIVQRFVEWAGRTWDEQTQGALEAFLRSDEAVGEIPSETHRLILEEVANAGR